MADLLDARQLAATAFGPGARVMPARSRLSLRGAPGVMTAAGRALGVDISGEACRSAQGNGRTALWMGPDEQLILGTPEDSTEIARSLAEALAEMPHSLVDIGHRQMAIEVAGVRAEELLSVGCPLDLHLSRFPEGMCTRTLLGKASIVLWRTGAARFQIEVWRSFAGYLAGFLTEAAREFAC